MFDGGSPIHDYRLWHDNASGDGNYVILADGLDLSYTSLGLLQGNVYSFKVQVRNDYGYSDFSNIVSILAAQEPDIPDPPSTVFNFDHVTVSWFAPDNAGSPITAYSIFIRQNDMITYSLELSNCDGSVS